LKGKIRDMMIEDCYFEDPTIVPANADALDWITKVAPGRLITTFLSDIGLPPAKNDKGFRKSTLIMDKVAMREHLERLRDSSFDPKGWDRKGYVLKGSIRTDGRLLQLLAFKVKELQCVRYRRLAPDKMPNLLTSPVGGTTHFLTEARNAFRSSRDIEELLTTDPDKIAVLSLDLGTSCLVGASVSLPQGETPATLRRPDGKKKSNKKTRRGLRKPGMRKRRSTAFKAQQQAKRLKQTRYFDLVIKRRAVSQPMDKFTNWLEDQKKNTIGVSTGKNIADLESDLPALRGEGASFTAYVTARRQAETDLDQFYNHTNFWKHQWDARLGRQEEFEKVANGLLRMVGGSSGRPRRDDQKVVVAIGLAKFTSTHGPPSLNGSFEAFFTNKVSNSFASADQKDNPLQQQTNGFLVFVSVRLVASRPAHSDTWSSASMNTIRPSAALFARTLSRRPPTGEHCTAVPASDSGNVM
jgi:hypothetical protein